ncbi:Alcohol dehydrogenase superfamily [Macleaya cordata]|uniref:Alcohol dehydrogenase superfamily n=1 Tax=Macleaya cordata TaxID=56857 RepID=A0A200RB69_MACCD|nr:Alcohol dehydrogenase superfamily [Macleaya cordata]
MVFNSTNTKDCQGWAARDPTGVLSPYKFSRRVLGSDDVSRITTHCGVCYADVLWTRNKFGDSKYPLVPGHEIAGIVMEVGSNIHCFKTGDHVGVGTYSCRDCEYCNDGLEVHCSKGKIFTFNSTHVDGTITKGGYSSYIVAHERQVKNTAILSLHLYCYKIPDNYPLASAAPLLCAGITVYSPMMRHKMNQPGKSLGVIGLGGLGHMAVKFGKAFGLHVIVFSTSISKKEETLNLLGAHKFVISSDIQQMQASAKPFDFIVGTASGDHPFDPYMAFLKTNGILVLVGFPREIKLNPASLNIGSKTISGSVTGGTKDTQEMIDFCAKHKIYPEIEVIPIQYINEAVERLISRDVKYRFVVDIESSLKCAKFSNLTTLLARATVPCPLPQPALPNKPGSPPQPQPTPPSPSSEIFLSISLSVSARVSCFEFDMSTRSVEDCQGWAARDPTGVLSPYKFSRRVLGSDDVSLTITHCGVCYADVVWTRNIIGDSKYPLVPGHEIVGIVTEVGSNIHRFKTGDHVGVGTYVNSCRDCEYCNDGIEVHCSKGAIFTFNSVDVDGTITKGGYSSYITYIDGGCHINRYCYKIPDNYPLASAAPLLCAGITVYSPMMRHKMNQAGKSLGVIGLGGLGHMAVKFGKAFGLHVTVFSTSISKKDEALNLLGADKFVISSDIQQMQDSAKSLDFIIDTASGDHPFDPYMALLKTYGVLVLVGFPSEVKINPASLNIGSKTISGSVTGGTKDTQEMIDFCAAHKIYPEIEVIPIQYINEALERLINRDVKYRFVIDIESSLK